MPPTKPTLPVFDVSAAITPTTNEPSCSLNTTDWTLGRSTTSSMMPNFVLGYSGAIFFSAVSQAKPTVMIGEKPSLANLRRTCSRCDSFWISRSRKSIAGLLLELRRAVEHALVERFVELAAKIIENGGLDGVGRIGRDGGEKTSGKSRRRHERDATEHILTSVWRERLPSPPRETNRLVE